MGTPSDWWGGAGSTVVGQSESRNESVSGGLVSISSADSWVWRVGMGLYFFSWLDRYID
jgi:hypothetical protein